MSGLHVYRNSWESVIAYSMEEAWDILDYDNYVEKNRDPIVQLPDDSMLTIYYSRYTESSFDESHTCSEWVDKNSRCIGRLGVIDQDEDLDCDERLNNWIKENAGKFWITKVPEIYML
jgi:hypothetical protein